MFALYLLTELFSKQSLVVPYRDDVGFEDLYGFPVSEHGVPRDRLVDKPAFFEGVQPLLQGELRRPSFDPFNNRVLRNSRDERAPELLRLAQEKAMAVVETIKGTEHEHGLFVFLHHSHSI